MPEIDYSTVHTVLDCATGQATDISLSMEEHAEQAARAEAHTAAQQTALEHRQSLLDTVHASEDPAIGALVELLGVR